MELTNGLGEKFYGLFFSLRKTKKDFETIADEINESPLRAALNGLSLNSAHFAGELKLQLQSLGIAPPRVAKTDVDDSAESSFEASESESGGELYTICASNEHSLTAAYNSLITEQLPHNSLYEIMMYQLNALKNTFKLVQALNAGRFANTPPENLSASFTDQPEDQGYHEDHTDHSEPHSCLENIAYELTAAETQG